MASLCCVVKVFLACAFISYVEGDLEIPCSPLELPCDGSGCIRRGTWCDSVRDCRDSSDEMFCASPGAPKPQCLPHHFKCDDGTCIPLGAKCDNYSDCRDGSDEKDETCNTTSVGTNLPSGKRGRNLPENPVLALAAIERAENWTLSRRDGNCGWGSDTARAVAALYIVYQQRYASTKEGELMKKQLNIELLVDIMKNETEQISLVKLANHVNALLATCQNPQSFQGLNLQNILRTRADQEMRSNRVAPLVLLTLCLAGESRSDDFINLYNHFLRLDDQQKMDLQAVVLTAISCISQQKSFRIREKSSDEKMTQSFAQRLAEKYETKGKRTDVYTTALVIQALNAAGFQSRNKSSSVQRLMKLQEPDGGFGDILATYYALPALAEKSLLSLKYTACHSKPSFVSGQFLPPYEGQRKEILYSLWFSNPVVTSRTINLIIGANWTTFDTMRHAAEQQDFFRFHYEETPAGPSVFSIGQVPDDSEREFQWFLYRKSKYANSEEYSGRNLLPFDIQSKPDSGDHIIWWYKNSNVPEAS